MWLEQWPLTNERIEAATLLVEEQLQKGHIEPSTSPWNTPIFVIKKKSGKWRLLQDLRKINDTMESMGALQPGLPSPSAIPKDDNIIVIDLQDCFFTIPLHPCDCQRFAFSLPSPNFQRPYQRYQWKVLPQGMKNSPTLCQKFVDIAILKVRKIYSDIYLVHYMDDILISHKDRAYLQEALQFLVEQLNLYGLQVAPEKVQIQPPFSYLGRVIQTDFVSPQPIQLRVDHLETLNDFQKLLGDINWIRPFLKITTGELKPLFDILHGDANPKSLRKLTPEAKASLALLEQKINSHRLLRVDYTRPWSLVLLATEYTPTACLWQQGPLEWLHLPVARKRVVTAYTSLVATLLGKGRKRSKELFGVDVHDIVIPYTADQHNILCFESEEWQIAQIGYTGTFSYHLPNHPLLHFIKRHQVIFPLRTKSTPLPPPAALVFTDGSASGQAALIIDDNKESFPTQETSAQRVELVAVITAFKRLKDKPFNLYTDSQYIVKLFPHIETAPLPSNHSTILALLSKLQVLIQSRECPFFVGHVRAHTMLPGPIHEGNYAADSLTKVVALSTEAAQRSHALHHQNASALRFQFHLPREAARAIVRNCSTCPSHIPALPMGVNPRGLRPGDLWQMDVTHIPSFGKLAFVHVCVDTFSHVVCASARSGEAFKDVVQHLFYCFTILGMPKAIKTDNAPAYTSKAFKKWCLTFNIKHSTGIPYNPQGQAIVERAHQTLKTQIIKLQKGDYKYSSPHHILNHALYVINHLNVTENNISPFLRHFDIGSTPKPLVKWKDLLTGQWKGPDILLASGRGYSCVFPQDTDSPLWLPDRLIRPYGGQSPDEKDSCSNSKAEKTTSAASSTPTSTACCFSQGWQ